MVYELHLGDEKYKDVNPLFIGYEKCKSLHSYGPNIRPYFLVHYIISGKGVLFSKGKRFDINKGQCFIIEPGEITTYTADRKDPWEYIWVAFNGGVAEKLKNLPNPAVECDGQIFSEIKDAYINKNASKMHITAKVYELMDAVLGKTKETKPNYPFRVKEYIKLHYMEEMKVQSIAESFGLDRRYLSRIFKEEYNTSIMQYIVAYRMKKATEYLGLGYSVSKVAVMTGYTDSFNFSKMFKKTYGISPRSYVKKKYNTNNTVHKDKAIDFLSGK